MNQEAKDFLNRVRAIARYWAFESRAEDPLEKCNGVAFSILSLIDGEGAGDPIELRIGDTIINDNLINLHEHYYNQESNSKVDRAGSINSAQSPKPQEPGSASNALLDGLNVGEKP